MLTPGMTLRKNNYRDFLKPVSIKMQHFYCLLKLKLSDSFISSLLNQILHEFQRLMQTMLFSEIYTLLCSILAVSWPPRSTKTTWIEPSVQPMRIFNVDGAIGLEYKIFFVHLSYVVFIPEPKHRRTSGTFNRRYCLNNRLTVFNFWKKYWCPTFRKNHHFKYFALTLSVFESIVIWTNCFHCQRET